MVTRYSWTLASSSKTPTVDPMHEKVARVDTSGLYHEEVVQQDIQVSDNLWQSSPGSQIALPSPGPAPQNGCNIGLLGQPCGPIRCNGGTITAQANTAVSTGSITGVCVGIASCHPNPLSCADHAPAGTATADPGCTAFVGIWVSAFCFTNP